jgi:hypothetical protein
VEETGWEDDQRDKCQLVDGWRDWYVSLCEMRLVYLLIYQLFLLCSVIIDPAEEIAHVRLVDHLRTTVYNRPFLIPAPEPLNLRQPATSCHSTPTKFKPGRASGIDVGSPLKKRRLGAEPSSEVEMNGTMGMSSTATGYGDRVSRLDS